VRASVPAIAPRRCPASCSCWPLTPAGCVSACPHMLSLKLCRPAAAASVPCRHNSLRAFNSRRMSTSSTAAAAANSPGPAAEQAEQAATSTTQPAADPIVQWVVLRRDLWQDLGWPLGAVVAQACHASTAAVFTHLSDELTQEYIHNDHIDHMHKVRVPSAPPCSE
jgi:hypothetical protein